jgi:hypothetical protein
MRKWADLLRVSLDLFDPPGEPDEDDDDNGQKAAE